MAKPNLAYIPATIGDKVYSILPSDGVGDFDFTRADGSSPTGVTRINAQGLIEEVASGENRLNYSLLDGEVVGCPSLLLEPQSTNLVTYSEDFSNAIWLIQNATVTTNDVISPDGTQNADKLIENSSNSTHRILTVSGLTISGNVVISVFAKKGERNWIRLTNNNIVGAFFDLENGLIGGVSGGIDAKIEKYNNGWYRCSISATAVANERIGVYLSNNGVDTTYQGDGASGVYIWGATIEQQSYITSYIKTNGSAVTRAAETCNGSGNADTFNDSEGVLMLEASSDETTSVIWSVSDGSNSNAVSLYYGNQGVICDVFSSAGTRTLIATMPIGFRSNMNKFSIKYKSTDLAIWLNGFELAVSTQTISLNGLNELEGAYGSGSFPFYGKTKQIQYFDSALSDTELEQLTSWDSFRAMAEGQLYSIE